jgi:hypothetical protein
MGSCAVSKTGQSARERIDALMEEASCALVARQYFQTERLCLEALNAANAVHDYERMARILLPLQEARRLKRQLAYDAGNVTLVDGDLPLTSQLRPGCYLVQPPRVGLDGRTLREALDRAEIPGVVVVREPTTRTGLWPIVALGPCTVRVRLEPPRDLRPIPGKGRRGAKAATAGNSSKAGSKGGTGSKGGVAVRAPTEYTIRLDPVGLPPVEWFESALEALGDAAIREIDPARPCWLRVDELLLRLQTVPDHEKLHQRLAEACLEAARTPCERPPLGLEFDADLGDDDPDEEV